MWWSRQGHKPGQIAKLPRISPNTARVKPRAVPVSFPRHLGRRIGWWCIMRLCASRVSRHGGWSCWQYSDWMR